VPELTDGDFHQEVVKSKLPYLVDFWAVWCGPCRMMAPVVDEIARLYEGKLKVGKVNVDHEIKTASEFGISSIPTLIVFVDGKESERIVGAVPKDFLVDKLERHLNPSGGEKGSKSGGKEKK
jgi:thioredoxin 1